MTGPRDFIDPRRASRRRFELPRVDGSEGLHAEPEGKRSVGMSPDDVVVEHAAFISTRSATSGGRPRPLRTRHRRRRWSASADDARAGRRQVSFKSTRSPIHGIEQPSFAPAFVTPRPRSGFRGIARSTWTGESARVEGPTRGVRNQPRVNCVVASRFEFEKGGIRCESVCSEHPGVFRTGTRGRTRNTSTPGSGNSMRADRGDGVDTSVGSGSWP